MVSDARTRRAPGTRRERAAVARRGEQTLVKKRMEAVFLLFLGAIGVLAIRLGDLQGFRSRGFVALAHRMQTRKQKVEAPRGRIVDRNGKPVAMDVLGESVCLNPRLVQDPATTAAKLAEQLGLDDAQRTLMQDKLTRMKEKRSAYVQLQRAVDRRLAEKALTLARTEPALGGLWLEPCPVRVYPAGPD